jgi:hypothetical protein
LDADTFAAPPRLEVEGICRVRHKLDLTDLADSQDAASAYRATLLPLIKELSGADELLMAQMPPHRIARQAHLSEGCQMTISNTLVI